MRACFPVGFSPLPFLALLDDPEEAAPVFPHIRPQTPLARIVLVLLRKLALQRCELELLRSHPKDERGSVREIGLWIWIEPNLHFLELSPTLWWELPRC